MVVELHHQFAHHIWLCHILLFLVPLRFQNSLRRTLGRRVWSKNGNHWLWRKAESDRVQSSSSFSRLGNSPSCCWSWCLYTSGGETKRLSSVKKCVYFSTKRLTLWCLKISVANFQWKGGVGFISTCHPGEEDRHDEPFSWPGYDVNKIIPTKSIPSLIIAILKFSVLTDCHCWELRSASKSWKQTLAHRSWLRFNF